MFYQRSMEHRVICDHVLKAFQCISGNNDNKDKININKM